MEFKNYKPENGKLLKIFVEFTGSKIAEFKLRGDFFMHPESSLETLEEFMLTLDMSKNFTQSLERFLVDNQIQVFGFIPQDLYDFLTMQYES